MSELTPVFLVCILLGYLSHRTSIYELDSCTYVRRDKAVYIAMAVVAIVFVGLRTKYNDTSSYLNSYTELIPSDTIFSGIDWAIGENPLFWITNRVLKLLGFSAQSFLMFYAFATLGIYMWFIRKYTNNIALSVYLLFTMGVYVFTMAAVKQCVAVAIALVGIDRAIQKKYISFVIYIVLATLFHPFAMMFLLCPFLCYRTWNWQTYLLLALCLACGFTIQRWFGNILEMMADFGIDYDIENISGEGVNVFRVAVMWAPMLLSLITTYATGYKADRASYLIMNLSMVCAVFMFIALFGNPVYFGRLANYFLIFQTISLPWLLQYFEERSKWYLTIAVVVCYFAYFYYGNVLSGISFDTCHTGISLVQYLVG